MTGNWLVLSPSTIYNPLTGEKRFYINGGKQGDVVAQMDRSTVLDQPVGGSGGLLPNEVVPAPGSSVYVAGAWVDMLRLREERAKLEQLGYIVTSRWMEQVNRPYSDTTEMFQQEADKDYADITRADFLIIDTLSTGTRGGREWEGGFATGSGKPVFRVGPVIIPFHTRVTGSFSDWDQALEFFRPRQ